MRTYRAGSLTLTNASTTIVGVGTAFVANVAVGDIVVVENGQCLEVVSVPDDTHLTVSSPAKESGSFNYAALRFVMAVNFRDLSIKIEQFLSDRQFSLGEFSDWMSGTLTGGPNGDGRYPLTDRNKVTRLFMCPELIAFGYQDSIDQATAAAASATAALGSKNAAATSATAAASSATAAASSATAAAGSATAANTSKVNAATSETNALASKNAAATSATNAATSETNALSSKNAAATSATNASGSATAAATSATNAASSSTSAGTSATNAASSATAAATSATAAASSATAADASKTAAATSATNAATSETAANTSKNAAATSATAADSSKTAAASSATAAASSATAAAGSATAANTSKVNAATSEANAGGSATAAATSATNAASSATAAASSATAANTSKTNAATSETNALASKNAAATSATNAATSETNASASATAAAGSATAANTSKDAAAASAAAADASATSAAAGSLSGLDKMPTNLISNPQFISTASLFTTDVTNGTVSYVDSTDASVPAGCPVARVGKSLKKVASQLLTLAFPLANAAARITCVPGEKFDVCIWMNVVGGGSTGTDKARLVCVESDAVTGGTFIANTRVLSYDQVVGGWQKLTGTFTASATTRSFTIGVWNETAMPVNGTIFFGEPELARRNSIMGLLGSMGFGDYASPLIFDLNANTTAGPFQCLAAAATSAGLPNNLGHSGIQLRQSATSNLQIVSVISSSPTLNRKLYWRNSYNSVWTAWSEVAAANNGTLVDAILSGETLFSLLTTSIADDTVIPSSSDTGTVIPSIRATGAASTGPNVIAAQGYTNTTANFGSSFVGTRSYGATGAHGAVASGRSVCTLLGAASDGTTYRKVGRIDFYTEEAPTATSSAGSVRILTTPVGAVTPTLSATFTSDGRLVVVGGGSFGGALSVSGTLSVAMIAEATISIASAATTDIGTAASNVITITGTTTITALGVAVAGTRKQVRFAGALTLTHNATSMNLIGNANIVTAVDDVAEFRSSGSGNWMMTNYVRANGLPIVTVSGVTSTPGLFTPGGAVNEAATVTIASNTTTDIGAAASNTITVTGTVAIGALGTANAGVRRIVKFAGSLVLAHNATSLILPTAANITTAANDTAEFLSLGSGNWLCTAYNRISGKPLNMENVDNTSDVNKPVSTAMNTALTNGLATKQASLGFTPVQQGTGVSQTTNIVKIGWSAVGKLKVTVDSTDLGNVTFEGVRHLSPNFEASAYVESKAYANQYNTDAPFVVKTQTLNNASEYSPMIKMKASYAGGTDSISMGVLSSATDQSLVFHWGASGGLSLGLLAMKRDGSLATFSGGIAVNTTIVANQTINAINGCYNNGSLTWSAATFNPNTKLNGATDGLPGNLGGYNKVYAPYYQNFTAAQQVYNGAIEIREANQVGNGGAAPGHIFNAPGITFHWSVYAVSKLMMTSGGNMAWGDPNGTYAQLTVGGDIIGNTWGGGALSTWLNATCLTTANWRTRLADLRTGELGSFAMAAFTPSGSVALNTGVVGSNLVTCSSQGSNQGVTLAGNWYCAGFIASSLQNTLWQRYV